MFAVGLLNRAEKLSILQIGFSNFLCSLAFFFYSSLLHIWVPYSSVSPPYLAWSSYFIIHSLNYVTLPCPGQCPHMLGQCWSCIGVFPRNCLLVVQGYPWQWQWIMRCQTTSCDIMYDWIFADYLWDQSKQYIIYVYTIAWLLFLTIIWQNGNLNI